MVDCKVDILCRTYDGDEAWLTRSIPTWQEHMHGFGDIVVTGITEQCGEVMDICRHHGVKWIADDESAGIPHGYINQQYTKMRADLFVDGEYVMFLDADTLCYGPTTPDDWFTRDLPDMLYSTWDQVGDALCWRAPTTFFIGDHAEHEYMRRLPLMYPTSVVKGCREHMDMIHGKGLLDILKGVRTFSEFNVLGAYAWQHRRDEFNWICPEKDGIPPNPFKQFWSHGGTQQVSKYKHNG